MGLLPELRPCDVIFLHCPTCAFQMHFLSRLGEHFEAGAHQFGQAENGGITRLVRLGIFRKVAYHTLIRSYRLPGLLCHVVVDVPGIITTRTCGECTSGADCPPGANFDPADVQSTLCEVTAATIGAACKQHIPDLRELLICGGGAHNKRLTARIAAQLPDVDIKSTEALNLHPDWVEAAAFAWLAHRRLEGRSGNEPSVTGASRRLLLGGVYRPG